MRVLIVRRNHVAAAVTPRASAVNTRSGVLCASRAPASTANHNARSASGSAASSDSANAHTISDGSWRNPSLHTRHIEGSAGGSASRLRAAVSDKDFVAHALLVFGRVETLCLQLEHRPIAPAERHQLLVRAKLDHLPLLEHADTVGMAHRREPMRDQNGGGLARRLEDA